MPQAIEDVSGKLSILIEHQREIERARNDMVVSVITLFGIISILASVLSIIQILSDGSQAAWLGMISSVLLLGGIAGGHGVLGQTRVITGSTAALCSEQAEFCLRCFCSLLPFGLI